RPHGVLRVGRDRARLLGVVLGRTLLLPGVLGARGGGGHQRQRADGGDRESRSHQALRSGERKRNRGFTVVKVSFITVTAGRRIRYARRFDASQSSRTRGSMTA